ncbi:hypothetical protein TNCV_4119891 [Trichonephila clavipes]|nr:hypothetical protein TNCV_4119891 [Trichonephila clavipes]
MAAFWCATGWYKRQHLSEETPAKPFRLRPLYRSSTRNFEIYNLEIGLSMSYDNRDQLARAPNYSKIDLASHLNLNAKIADLSGQPITEAPLRATHANFLRLKTILLLTHSFSATGRHQPTHSYEKYSVTIFFINF